MKNEQQQQAKELYFQTNLSKTEIAGRVGVNRRTVMLWSHQGNWDQLKRSAQHLPSIVAEKCYYLIDHFTSHLLATHNSMSTVTSKDAETIYKLASSIRKLKNRSTVNESMEMFNFFIEGLRKTDPGMAEQLMPIAEKYIESRIDVNVADFLMDGFDKNGELPYPEKEIIETWQDEKDADAINQEFQKHLSTVDSEKDQQTISREFQKFVAAYDTTPLPNLSLVKTIHLTIKQHSDHDIRVIPCSRAHSSEPVTVIKT